MLRSFDLGIYEPNSRRRRGSRRRRMIVDQPDRRALECAGWRTLLDYTENHTRSLDGTLLAVVPRWTAEAEHADAPNNRGRVIVAYASGSTPDEVWAEVRRQTTVAALRPYDGANDL